MSLLLSLLSTAPETRPNKNGKVQAAIRDETRAKVLAAVTGETSARLVAAATGLHPKTCINHMHALVAEGKLDSRLDGSALWFRPSEATILARKGA